MTPTERKWALINVVPIAFLLVDAAVWYWATPIGFQRFGSIGVLAAALMFGMDRISRMKRPAEARRADDLMLTELGLVAVATFQWGYGDLFHCWTSGLGWRACG